MQTYSEYAIFDTRKPDEPTRFVWHARHGIRPPLPAGNNPHEVKDITALPTETLAFMAIGQYPPVLDLLGREIPQTEPEYYCSACKCKHAASAFGYDGRNTRRGFTKSICRAADADASSARYHRHKEAKRA